MATPKPISGNTRSRSHAIKPGVRTRKSLAPLTWRNDPWVRRRIANVAMLVASGYSFLQMEDAVAEWCAGEHQPPVKVEQLKIDYKHYWELMAEEVHIDAEQHAEALRLFKREGFQGWRNVNEGAMVRSTGLTTAMEAEKQLMRLSGVLVSRDVLQKNVVIQTLSPELVGSDEYRAAVGELIRLLPADPNGASPKSPR
jgi:hypothetical protein